MNFAIRIFINAPTWAWYFYGAMAALAIAASIYKTYMAYQIQKLKGPLSITLNSPLVDEFKPGRGPIRLCSNCGHPRFQAWNGVPACKCRVGT